MTFNRRTRSFLPSISSGPNDTCVKEKRDARKRSVKKSHDRKSRKLSEIDVGQSVFFQHSEGRNWKLDKVTDILCIPDGGMHRTNRVHMRSTKAKPKARDQSPVVLPHIPDVTPLALPEQSLQISNPPMDPPGETNQPGGVEKVVLMNSPGHSLSANRPRREVRLPIRFKDCVIK